MDGLERLLHDLMFPSPFELVSLLVSYLDRDSEGAEGLLPDHGVATIFQHRPDVFHVHYYEWLDEERQGPWGFEMGMTDPSVVVSIDLRHPDKPQYGRFTEQPAEEWDANLARNGRGQG